MVRVAIYVLLLLVAACAHAQATPSLPGTFGSGEPLPPPVAPEPGGALAPAPTPLPRRVRRPPPDPGAEADFRDAKARFDAGDRPGAGDGARGVRRASPAASVSPLRRSDAGAARARCAATRRGAKKLLEPLVRRPPEPGAGSSARYYLGLAEVRLGQFARGRELLLPFLPPAGAVGPGRRDAGRAARRARRGDRRRRRAAGGARAARRLRARRPRAREGLRAVARRRDRRGDLPRRRGARLPGGVRAGAGAGGARRQGGRVPARAGGRGRGDRRRRRVGRRAARARLRRRRPRATRRGAGAGDPNRLGLALALSGKFQPVGEAAMRAAMLATGGRARRAPGSGSTYATRGRSRSARRPA